jgi:hypothetical protein
VGEFAVWNYFTGPRHRPGAFYAEGEKYPLARTRNLASPAKVAVQHREVLDHLACAYLRLEPQRCPGGLSLRFAPERGQWRAELLLIGADSLLVQALEDQPVQVAGWDQYREVVPVLVSSDTEGLGYGYGLELGYGPDLVDLPSPLALRLGPGAPNPFRPSPRDQVLFPFELDQPSPSTYPSIFSAAGLLVRRYDLGPRAAGPMPKPGMAATRRGNWWGRGSIMGCSRPRQAAPAKPWPSSASRSLSETPSGLRPAATGVVGVALGRRISEQYGSFGRLAHAGFARTRCQSRFPDRLQPPIVQNHPLAADA